MKEDSFELSYGRELSQTFPSMFHLATVVKRTFPSVIDNIRDMMNGFASTAERPLRTCYYFPPPY